MALRELTDPIFSLNGLEVILWAVVAAAWPVGYAFARRSREAQALARRAEEATVGRDAAARAAVSEEQARIARELHDVVGHGISVAVLHLVAAAGMLDKGEVAPAQPRLLNAEHSARDALAELRRLLGLLDRDAEASLIDLEDDLEVIGEAADGVEALAAARGQQPDVALVDIQMPNMDGVELTSRLLALPAPPRVVVLTTFDRNEYVYQAMRAGASGFLLKDVRRGQLTDAIRAVMRDDTLLAPTITRRLIEQFCRIPSGPGGVPPQLAELTSREREVLTLIARGLSNTEIAAELFVAETTVKTHAARILTKLGLRDRAQAVVIAYETGLVRAGEAH